MNINKIFKALSNEARLKILEYLKDPNAHFDPKICNSKVDAKKVGVCVGLLQQKLGLSQSTTSHYLNLLQEAGLIQAKRIGQWTYYCRNEQVITQYVKELKKSL